jgi:hypothetical protein
VSLNGSPEDRAAIDALVRHFFAAFTNQGDSTPDVEGLTALFIPSGVISKALGDEPEVHSVRSFIEPRAQLLTNGTLTEFREEETASRTDILGNVAQRVSLYRKSGTMSGDRFEGKGIKVFQFVRTAGGWRISAVAWDDERDGLSIPAGL